MTSERLEEMFKGVSADARAEIFARVDGGTSGHDKRAQTEARTPISS